MSRADHSTQNAPGGLLQRKCACGGAARLSGDCGKCSDKLKRPLQTKLEVGRAGDHFEQEADRLAEEVMRGPSHAAPHAVTTGLQRRAVTPVGPNASGTAPAPPSVEQALDSPGRPLDAQTRAFMESRFGHDFGRVRVHADERADESARAVEASAYTVGDHLVFAAGRYAPHTHEGRRLIAHELAHVLQQGGASRAAPSGHVGPVQPSARGLLQRQPAPARKARILSAEEIVNVYLSRKEAYDLVGRPPKARVCRSKGKAPTAENCPAELEPGAVVNVISGEPGAGWLQIENTGAFSGFGPKEPVYILGVFAVKLSDENRPVTRPIKSEPSELAADLLSKAGEPLPPSTPTPLFDWTIPEDAFKGIVPDFKAKGIPHPGWTDTERLLKHGPYKIINNLRRNEDGTSSILYYVAYRTKPGYLGPTNWNEWVIGPDSIEEFISKVDSYAAGGAAAYMFGPPPPNVVEGERFVKHFMAGELGEAGKAYKDALYESVTDVNWWIQMVTATAGVVDAMAPPVPRLPGAGPAPIKGPPPAARPTGPPKLTVIEGGKSQGTTSGGNVSRLPRGRTQPSASQGGGDFAYRGGSAAQKMDPAPAPAQRPQLRVVEEVPEPKPAAVPEPLPEAPPPAPVEVPAQAPGQVPAQGPAAVGAAGAAVTPKGGQKTGEEPAPEPSPFPEVEEKRRSGSCPTGLSEADPIEMVWLKPLRFYKSILKLDGGGYPRLTPKKLLRAGRKYGPEQGTIGVKDWPGVGSTLHRISTPRDESVTRHFIEATADEGFEEWDQFSPDHVRDLFFEGADHFKNLWPLDRDTNERAGHWHANQSVCFSDAPGLKPRVESLCSARLVGRWFVIRKVGEPPPMSQGKCSVASSKKPKKK